MNLMNQKSKLVVEAFNLVDRCGIEDLDHGGSVAVGGNSGWRSVWKGARFALIGSGSASSGCAWRQPRLSCGVKRARESGVRVRVCGTGVTMDKTLVASSSSSCMESLSGAFGEAGMALLALVGGASLQTAR